MQAKQLAEWGADGVIVGSALVKALGEAPSKVPPAPPPKYGPAVLPRWPCVKVAPLMPDRI